MAASSESKTTTVRLSDATKKSLENASRILRKTQNQVMEDALSEYFERHNLIERYEARVFRDQVILLRINGTKSDIVDARSCNGLSTDKIVEQFATTYRAPVDLVKE